MGALWTIDQGVELERALHWKCIQIPMVEAQRLILITMGRCVGARGV